MSMISEPSSCSPDSGQTDRKRGRNRPLRRLRSAKIVATIGPASAGGERLRALFDAGVDVFRLNFSHGTHEEHRARFAEIRQVESDTGRPIGILADLQGPKLRLGDFAGGKAEIAAGGHFRLDLDKHPGDQNRAPLPHPEVFEALHPGTELLLDDGKVRLRVVACGADLADTLMVARGDLGVEMPPEDVPSVQKQVIHACRLAGKPVIVATQMLESMITAPTPTRAEASDVATAVYEGADAVMLSAETAVGEYPVEAVAMMDRIAYRVQQDPLYYTTLAASHMEPEHTNRDAITAGVPFGTPGSTNVLRIAWVER